MLTIIPLNSILEPFKIVIGYILDGTAYKSSDLYEKGSHQISIKIH